MIDPTGMLTTYNWSTGQYEDEHGGNVGFEQAKHEYGIGQSGGCPPNCPQNVAKADATERAQNTVTPQIADGGITLPQSEQATLYNADLKYQHGTQYAPHEKASQLGVEMFWAAESGYGLYKGVLSLKNYLTAAKATKGVQTTIHGAARIAGPAATRGGVLSIVEVNATKSLGRAFTQADGANVFLHEITPGRFNAVIQNQTTGKVITSMGNWSQKSINRIAKNYGWPIQ